MKCRYCGRDIKSTAGTWRTNYGTKCEPSPSKKHVAISDGVTCVYCGRETRVLGQNLTTAYGIKCQHSPTGKHILQ